MNEMITAGPATGMASLSTKKIPVPTVAPTPNIISWNVPRLRVSSSPVWCLRWKMMGLRRSNCWPNPTATLLIWVSSLDRDPRTPHAREQTNHSVGHSPDRLTALGRRDVLI